MGNFYVNHTVCGQDLPAVIHYLAEKEAYVSKPKNGCLVIFDKASEPGIPPVIEALGTELSRPAGARVLSVVIADDDVMYYWLFRDGKLADTYDSNPDYGEVVETPRPPEGGDAKELSSAFGFSDPQAVERVLRAHGDAGYTFQFERHKALAAVLGLPQEAIATGFSYLEAGEFPKGFGPSDFEVVTK